MKETGGHPDHFAKDRANNSAIAKLIDVQFLLVIRSCFASNHFHREIGMINFT